MKHPLVLVEWQDSASADGWQDEMSATERSPSNCETVGWMLSKTRGYVTLAGSRSNSTHWSQIMSIPRGCIKSIRTLETCLD